MADKVNATEEQARELAEQSRQSDWAGRSFLRNLFLGDFRLDWIDPFPETEFTPEFNKFYAELEEFFETKVDSVKIDETGEIPKSVIKGLAKMGVFGMKIPKEYDGMGFTNMEYVKALELVGRYDGNLCALISAHQSIGIPNPLKQFGTPEQKKKYLPRCAKGAISAFALTEPDVGSDPARLATTCVKDENGDWILNGVKLWCTNVTIAELMVVMAVNPETRKISAFIVEVDSEGVEIEHRCRFMGLKALYNGQVRFTNVKVPADQLLYKEGGGLKLALITLNTGRLSIPGACVGSSKAGLEVCREFGSTRVQWGLPIGRHEAVSHMISDMAATTYAMESLTNLATELSMREGYDIRLEAAAAKEWTTTRNWDILDTIMQIRGGRGYEEESSLKARGEKPTGEGRAMRDARINRIFEGSSEIMHLFMAREMVDKHLQVSGALLKKNPSIGDLLGALPGLIKFYGAWYPKQWLGWLWRPSYARYGKFASHLKFVESNSRRLARNVFHAMAWYQIKMERKQAFLFRTVDIAMELLVMAATVSRTQRLIETNAPNAKEAAAMAEMYCKSAERYVEQKFHELWANDDDAKTRLAKDILDGKHTWLEPQRTYTPTAPASGEDSAAAK